MKEVSWCEWARTNCGTCRWNEGGLGKKRKCHSTTSERWEQSKRKRFADGTPKCPGWEEEMSDECYVKEITVDGNKYQRVDDSDPIRKRTRERAEEIKALMKEYNFNFDEAMEYRTKFA